MRANLRLGAGLASGIFFVAMGCSSNNNNGGTTGSGGRGGGGGGGGQSGGAGGSAGGSGGSAGGAGGSAGAGGAGGAAGSSDAGAGSLDGAGDSIVLHDAATTDAGALVRTGWTAMAMPDAVAVAQRNPPSSESLATTNPFDGMNGTRWATGVFQSTLTFPLLFTVDMKQPTTVSRITLYAGDQDINDYPGRLDVAVSLDGNAYTTVVTGHQPMPPANGANRGIDSITIPAGTVARLIRLTATQARTGGNFWWAIGEMNVYP
jgi:hypothetical protein